MLPDNAYIVIVIVSIIDKYRLYLGRAICPQKYSYYLLAWFTLYYRCQMRSRCQGEYIDRYIHLFTYNIINYCLWDMRTCNTYNLIKGGHGCQALFCYSNPYQKIIPLLKDLLQTVWKYQLNFLVKFWEKKQKVKF